MSKENPFASSPEEEAGLMDAVMKGDLGALMAFAKARIPDLEAQRLARKEEELPVTEAGIRRRTVSDHGVLGRVVQTDYEAAPTPAPGYPTDLPFFPNVRATVGATEGSGESTSLMIFGLPNVAGAFDHVVSHATRNGWTLGPRALNTPMGRSGVLERAGRKRLLNVMTIGEHNALALQQLPAEGDPAR